MNKIILFSIVALTIMSGVALADTGISPCPLAFTFLTSPPGAAIGQTVTLTYLDKVFTGTVNEYGELVMDLGAEGIPNCNAQNFKLTVLACQDNPVCTQTVSFNPNGYTTIDITSANLFSQTCPQCPEDVTPYASCNSCCLAPDNCESQGFINPADCPVVDTTNYGAVLLAVLATLAAGYGIGVKKSKTGVKTLMHSHPNYTTMHNINTIHVHQPHPKGQLAPTYATTKGADGYYKYLG